MLNLELYQRVALVCASSGGIGKAIAKELARQGAAVSLFARNEGALVAASEEIAALGGGRVIHQVADLAKPQDLSQVVEVTRSKLGPIDILIHNQGGPAPGGFDDVTDAQLDSALEINLRAVIRLTRLCLPEMKRRGWGRILHVLSVSAKEPLAGMFLSNVLRPAVLGLSKTLATECARSGVTVNCILPSAVLTDRARNLMRLRAEKESLTLEQVQAESAKNLPIGYLASPEEFAQLALFLCSPKASYVTGTAIPVDGGFTRGLY